MTESSLPLYSPEILIVNGGALTQITEVLPAISKGGLTKIAQLRGSILAQPKRAPLLATTPRQPTPALGWRAGP
jgi:hypothetical protein